MDTFYVVEYPSFHGGNTKEYKRVSEEELVGFVNTENTVVYRILNEPMIIKVDLTLERKEDTLECDERDEAADTAKDKAELLIPPDDISERQRQVLRRQVLLDEVGTQDSYGKAE